MTNPTTPTFSNETYLNGFREADASAIEAAYAEFRKPVIRAIESAGGSHADGATFFRVAVIHAAALAHDQQLTEALPVAEWLKNLALAHFQDWAAEKGVELPAAAIDLESVIPVAALPDTITRQEFRQLIKARRQFSRLEANCQKIAMELAKDASLGISDPRLEDGAREKCLELYRQKLGDSAETWSNQMPAWVAAALTNAHFEQAWNAAESMESRLVMGQTAASGPKSNISRNVLIALSLLLAGYGMWDYFTAPKSPKAVYDENFNPPASIMADRAARFARDTIVVEQIAACEALFEEADALYQGKKYTDAAAVLYSIAGDETLESCKSDAWFYMAIIGLQLNEPEITIDCLAKIPDLERFGEDLYWYQALAFVKIAAQNSGGRDIARRAVERARSNTEIPERRSQAENMLKQLEK